MRHDSIGLFWQDFPQQRRGVSILRERPPIPDTGWTTPTAFPRLDAAPALSFDVEAYDPEFKQFGPGWARGRGHIVGVAVGIPHGDRWYFPMRHTVEPEYNLPPEHVLAWLRDTLANPRQSKIGMNLTYDIGWLQQEGVTVAGELHDIQFAEALLDEVAWVRLDAQAQRYLGERKIANLLYEWCAAYYGGPETDGQRANIYRAPPRLVGPYAEGDVDLPPRILENQWPLLHQQRLFDLYRMECELIPLTVAMRFAGVSVDVAAAEQLHSQLQQEVEQEKVALAHNVGFGVDVWASASLARAFDAIGVPYPYTAKGNPSFTAGFLETLEHPIGQAIRDIRAKEKLISTFLEGYILEAQIDGKVYGQFHQLRGESEGTRSGRYSSSNPNLQNIPVRTKLGSQIRRLFIPDLGHKTWIKTDFSQIEYRMLAHYAVGPRSDQIRALYHSDPSTDYHEMARELVASHTGQNLERSDIKTINFALIYGMGIKMLSRRLGLTEPEGKKLFAHYHKGVPFARATMDATSKEAEQLGFITTILGRRSRFDLWEPSDYRGNGDGRAVRALPYERAIRVYANIRRAYLHKALNRRLQGSAADLLKVAMHRCWQDGVFARTGIPRLTVHDELDFSDPGGVDDAFAELYHIMETAIPLRVPVRVDRKRGPNWGDAE